MNESLSLKEKNTMSSPVSFFPFLSVLAYIYSGQLGVEKNALQLFFSSLEVVVCW